MELVNVGESLKVNFTSPFVVVETDRLVEEAINLYKLEIEVVATTPLIVVVSTDPFSSNEEVLELIIVEVEMEPPMLEVRMLEREDSKLGTENLVTDRLSADKLVMVALVIVALTVSSEFENRLLNVGESLKVNFTSPVVTEHEYDICLKKRVCL